MKLYIKEKIMTETYIKDHTNTFNIRGIDIKVIALARFDSKNDKLVDDMELDDQALEIAKNEYRQRFNYIGPDDLKNLRKKWKLSQRSFAKVVGWSPSTIALYEAGEIPTSANNRLLKIMIKDPKVMKEFIEESRNDEKIEK